MFNSKKEKKVDSIKFSYTVTVEAVRATKNDSIVMVDLDKYYNRVWFPASNEIIESIVNQVASML